MVTPTRHLKLWIDARSKDVEPEENPADPGASGADGPGTTDEQIRRADFALRWLERRRPPRAVPEAGAPPEAVSEFLSRLAFPLKLGPFRVLRELGRGGFGVVLLAHRTPVGPPIALKLPRPEFLVSDELLKQFFQEARMAMRLDHPNLIRVSELGVIGPLHYISSPFYPGPTLARWLESRSDPVPIAEAVAIIAAVGEGLRHAHERGVLHRDISPSNIILVPDDAIEGPDAAAVGTGPGGFVPMLGDFGLARPIDEPEGVGPEGLAGSLNYLAPEEVDAELGPAGTGADLYAIGAVLYELLAGRPPFPADSRTEALRRIVAEPPTSLRVHRPDVPGPLDRICLRCLAKRPAERFETVGAFVDALRGLDRAGDLPG